MGEREKYLTSSQKNAIEFIRDVLIEDKEDRLYINKNPLQQAFNLTPRETDQVCAIMALVFHWVSRKNGGKGIDPNLKRKLAAVLINNPSGSRQEWEEKHGKVHIPKRHFRTGRNYTGRIRSQGRD